MSGETGYPFDWTVPFSPWDGLAWLVLLLGVATLCPNSLELMRRFKPALDFPEAPQPTIPTPTPPVASAAKADAEARIIGAAPPTIQRSWAVMKKIARTGLSLDGLTATMIGLLFELDTMALGHCTGFLYGEF